MASRFILFDQGPDTKAQGFANPSDMIVAWDGEQVEAALKKMDKAKANGKWLAGFASYELGYALEEKLKHRMPENRISPLICFGVFDGPDALSTRSYFHRARQEMPDAILDTPKPVWSEADYTKAFKQVNEYIKSGDFYQTNLTFPMRSHYSGSALGLYAALRKAGPVTYGAMVNLGHGPILISRSPELFFKIDDDGVIQTRPMKGTVPRGASQEEDDKLKTFLHNDPKNRAENLMIVDLLRNDISRIAEIGSVEVPELFTIESYATVHQMTSLVQAKLLKNTTLTEIFEALFPCGSITGAPKIRAMEVINDLEPDPRDIYCGSIGWIAPSGRMAFNVAIRTLNLFEDKSIRLNVGGGVVYDSTAPSEYEEALWKARYTNLNPKV